MTEQTVTLDLATLTLGEVAEAERQSGLTFGEILRGSAGKMTLALFVHRWRISGSVPSWREVSSLPVHEGLSSISALLPDSPGPTSSD